MRNFCERGLLFCHSATIRNEHFANVYYEVFYLPDSETPFPPFRSRSLAYVIRKDFGKFLRDRCELTLTVERNLEGAISHAVPDFNVAGELSSVHCSLDVAQVKRTLEVCVYLSSISLAHLLAHL